MRRNTKTWAVFSVDRRKPKIDPSPPYQRGLVWSLRQKQLFMDSMIRDFDIPKIYLRRIQDSNSQYEWEVVDGQQRLNAIWEFLANEYLTWGDADPIGGYEVAGKTFAELDSDVQDQLESYELSVVELEETEEQEIEEMFIRLQNGVPLNAAEKRNAVPGNVRAFVRNISSTHRFITESVSIRNTRYAHDEVVAQMLLIEMTGGPTAITAPKLMDMYEDGNRRFNSKSSANLRKVLNFLAKAFPEETPELTKATVISLYTVASESMSRYAISNRTASFRKWFVDFERRRGEERGKSEDTMNPEMREYQEALLQGSASVGSQKTRRNVLLEDLMANMPDLRLLDNQRAFTREQRVAIFRKFSGKCVNPDNNPDCVGDCTWDNFHADHIVPYSAGGKTTLNNGQLLCPSCNLKKSDKQPDEA